MPFYTIFPVPISNTAILSSSIPPTSLSKQVRPSTTSLFFPNSFSSSSSPYASILLFPPLFSSSHFSSSHSIASSQHSTYSGGWLRFSSKFPILPSLFPTGFFSFSSSFSHRMFGILLPIVSNSGESGCFVPSGSLRFSTSSFTVSSSCFSFAITRRRM